MDVRVPETDVIAGRYDDEYAEVTDVFRKQTARTDGGASVAVYHHGRRVVDLWGGVRNRDGESWERDTLAMCWSTTKGVTATCAHVLADRGQLDYDERVATYWPEFAQNGKGNITVRHVLSHSAGLHRFGTIIDHGSKMLDWEHMTDALARAKPAYQPGTAVGYHALTFGWLVGELVRRISGIPIEKFVQTEIAEPLGLDGLYIGCPPGQRHRVAPLKPMSFGGWANPVGRFAFNQLSRGLRAVRSPVNPHRMLNSALSPGMEAVLADPRLLDSAVPAMNGNFDAVSLSAMYAMLAGGGSSAACSSCPKTPSARRRRSRTTNATESSRSPCSGGLPPNTHHRQAIAACVRRRFRWVGRVGRSRAQPGSGDGMQPWRWDADR